MPAPKPKRPPIEILQSIDQKATKVRDAAAILTKRIEQFENYLSNLNGRVEAFTVGNYPGAPEDRALGLGLERSGKSWVITYHIIDYSVPPEPDEPDWQPLKEASLKIKVAAIQLFPDLLEAIEKSQEQLVGEIEKAVAQYDAFALTLPPRRANPQPLRPEVPVNAMIAESAARVLKRGAVQ
jgi:hypothetical protein